MKRLVFWSILFLILFHAANNAVWLALDNLSYIIPKEINNIEKALVFFREVNLQNFFTHGWSEFCGLNPPLYFLIPLALINILRLPFAREIFVFTNILYLGILFFSVYAIGKKLKNPQAGILAAIITSLYPGVFGFSRIYASNFALIGFFALFLWMLLKTDYFKNSLYSVLCGIIIGLGMLTRWTFIVFVFVPLSVYFIYSLKLNYNKYIKKIILNVFLITIISTALFLSWFLCSELLREFSNVTGHFVTGRHTFFGYDAGPAYTYFYIIIDQYLGLFFAFFFLLALFYAPRAYSLVCIGSVMFCFICFSFIAQKNIRYLAPILPAFGIITALGIERIREKYKIKKSLLYAPLICLGFIQFFILSYYPGAWKIYPVSYICRNTMKKHSGLQFLVTKIEQHRPHKQKDINIGISRFVKNRWVFSHNIKYYLNLNTLSINNPPAYHTRFCEEQDNYAGLDFLLREIVPHPTDLHPDLKKLYEFEENLAKKDFELIGEYTADTPVDYEGIEYRENVFRKRKNKLRLYKRTT